MKVHEQARQKKPEKINKLSTNHGGVAAIVNAGFELLQLHVAKQSIILSTSVLESVQSQDLLLSWLCTKQVMLFVGFMMILQRS